MKTVAPNFLDRMLAGVAPQYAVRRYQARLALNLTGQYAGARSDRQALKAWKTFPGSADADTLGDLTLLRSRSRDLIRNNPIATGALATSKSNIVGRGLRLRPEPDRELLGLSDEAAAAWSRRTFKLFNLWARSKAADLSRVQNFYELQGLLFRTVFESGDALVLRRQPGAPGGAIVPLALNVIEADRIITPPELASDFLTRQGVRIDDDGRPLSYCVANAHPGDTFTTNYLDWTEIPAFGAKSGELMALHVFERLRPGQSRGVPFLAPVVETLKQLDRYTEAELMSAVVSSFFTVFMKTVDDSGLQGATAPLPNMAPNEITLGPGSIVDIGKDEEIQVAQSSRANSNFDPFFLAVVRQIGVALSIPYELLIMHFTASYSASRAALEMAQQFFGQRRQWLADSFCQPVYEWFLSDAINSGLIAAPGFFDSPVARAAWLGSEWMGDPPIVLDPVKEWAGETAAVNLGAKTLERVTIERTGGDWMANTEQRGREHKARVAAGLEPPILDPGGDAAANPPDKPEPGDSSGGSDK